MSTQKDGAAGAKAEAYAKAAAVGEDDGLILFHAAGIATRCVSSVEEAEKALLSLVREGFSIIFLSESYAEQMAHTLQRYRRAAYPLILPIPDSKGPTGYSMKNITDNMEKAIGANLL